MKLINEIKEIFQYMDMIRNLVKRDLRGRYKGSLLGVLWNFVNPLCQILVYIMVFSVIFPSNLENYYVYLVSGMIPWFFFSESLAQGAGCIVYQADMTKKIYFPREVLPITTVSSRFINMLLSFIVVFLVVLVSGVGVGTSVVWLPLVMIVEYIMTLGLTLVASAVTVYFRDIEHIISVILMAWIWITPIMYSADTVPEEFRGVLYLNPMTSIIEAYHDILYYKTAPVLNDLLLSGGIAIGLLIVGMLVFIRLERRFAEEL